MNGPVHTADLAHSSASRAMSELFEAIVQIDEQELWRSHGARDIAHFVQMRYGLSMWEAHRWVNAADALGELPHARAAFAEGALGLDKVLELCRFATPETEERLTCWASRVSVTVIRARADEHSRQSRQELVELERSRSLHTWYSDEGRRFGLEAELPAAEGAIIERALQRLASQIPAMPGEQDGAYASARRADALVALASAEISADPDPDRATLIVHVPVASLAEEERAPSEHPAASGGPAVQGGPPVPAPTVARLLCTSRIQTVIERADLGVVGVSDTSRLAPAWMLRQVRYRDRGCRFPGCGARRFTEAHHVTFWRDGGTTSLENLVLICSFHHRLVHEHGWRIERQPGDSIAWRRPDGTAYVPIADVGTGPPARAPAELVGV